ncbi:hypothetical protein LNI90_04940 [Tenacibaculum dicentrarchi]|nr:hypothetical protein [Tenacibaculum dicentrarchi]
MRKDKAQELTIFNISKTDKDDYLWKFVSIEKFLSIILNTKMYFTRIDCFEDLQEGISPQLLLLNHQKKSLMTMPHFAELNRLHSIDLFPKETDLLIDQLKETQKLNFANCWHTSKENIESVAMWNLYSEPNSVALNISFEDFYLQLQKSGVEANITIESLTLGKVKYLNFQSPKDIDKAKKEIENTSFLKDLSFRHESEFRFVAKIKNYDIEPFSPKKGLSKYMQKELYERTSQIYGLNVLLRDFKEYKFEIVFHPKIENWVKEDLLKVLRKFDIPFKTRESNLKIK